MQEKKIVVSSADDMQALGVKLGKRAQGLTTIELTGDVGAGKTTLTKGIAKGLGVEGDVASPSFTLSRTYASSRNLELHHYDFYRLEDFGILLHQLQESLKDEKVVTVLEWAKSAVGLLPENRISINIKPTNENSRLVTIRSKEKIAL